jgi:hypothetical protein
MYFTDHMRLRTQRFFMNLHVSSSDGSRHDMIESFFQSMVNARARLVLDRVPPILPQVFLIKSSCLFIQMLFCLLETTGNEETFINIIFVKVFAVRVCSEGNALDWFQSWEVRWRKLRM